MDTTSQPPLPIFNIPSVNDQQTKFTSFAPPTITADDSLETAFENRSFRLHVTSWIAICSVSFAVWFIVRLFTHEWPWFIFAFSIAADALAIHYFVFIVRDKLVRLHLFLFANTSMLLLICSIIGSSTSHKWFVFVTFAWFIMFSLHWTIDHYEQTPELPYYLHRTMFVSMNLFIFQMWVLTGAHYPFWLIVLCISFIPMYIHWWNCYWKHNTFILHLGVFVGFQLMFFFIWATNSQIFPWFIAPLAVWGAFLVLHYYRFNKYPTRQESQVLAFSSDKGIPIQIYSTESRMHS